VSEKSGHVMHVVPVVMDFIEYAKEQTMKRKKDARRQQGVNYAISLTTPPASLIFFL
jgi:hypothetical protein